MRDAIWSRTLSAASRRSLLTSESLPRTADVIVVGAGLIGLCSALALRRRGVRNIAVVDRTSVGGESTGASAGGLWPGHECLSLPSPALARAAGEAQARICSEFPCDYVRSGLLHLLGESEVSEAAERAERTRRAGFAASLVSGRALAELEPALRHDGPAIHFPGDGSIHPLKLAAGIAAWLRANGVRICLSQEVRAIDKSGLALSTSSGRASAGAIVIAGGAWTPLLTKLLGWEPPIRPVRGALLATEAQPQGTLRTVVVGPRYYYWQLGCGPLAGGGSEEDVGFAPGVDSLVKADIRAEWKRLFPALGHVPVTCRWFGFRPYCEDMQPVIGAVPGVPGAYVSAGHFRKGIMLAPLSGEILAAEITDGAPSAPAAFRPERFPAPAAGGRDRTPGPAGAR